jgi:DNA-binding transcriptional regulator PaaX
MADLILEPYAVSQCWSFSEENTNWESLIVEYLETIARTCVEFDRCVIGHIKALALFPGGDYLQVSVIDPDLPAGVKGHVPPGCNELRLSLNVIVYGLDHDLVGRIASETAVQIAGQRQGEVIIET